MMTTNNSYANTQDEQGHFGIYGGCYVGETLMPLINAVKDAWEHYSNDDAYWADVDYYAKHYTGRPSPLYYAERMTNYCGGAKIYFKRDELNHTGSHKINNVLGQILIAKRMGHKKIIAETGAGQHGVAVATVCALFDMKCTIFMGAKDVERQQANVFRMRLLGADINPCHTGSATLKDAMNEALRYWIKHVDDTFYIIGTAAGPHPYPTMVRTLQSVISKEAKQQILEQENRLPNAIIACIGGGSNAIGLFHHFLDEADVAIYGVEAAGKGLNTDEHAASLTGGVPGILHGNRTYLLQNDDGQIQEAYSISAGLDYPGIGPEHAFLRDAGRVQYVSSTDDEAVEAFQLCSRLEGIIPALEPSHAIAYTLKLAKTMPQDNIIIMNLCGRGDKDVSQMMERLHYNESI